jgi:hypothetical protein
VTFESTDVRPLAPQYWVGVAITATNPAERAMHVGLVYRSPNLQVRFAHLAFHHRLLDGPAHVLNGYLWSDCMFLAGKEMAATAEFIANYIASVARTTAVPYGTDSRGTKFDSSGAYQTIDRRRGLTCATFISRVFEDAGFPIVLLETWPRRESDAEWRDSVLKMLRQYGEEERATEIADQEVPFRLSPAEVAVAAADNLIPLTFEQAVERSEPLLRRLFPE